MENIVTKKFIESLEWRSFEEFCYLIFKSSNKWQVELNSFGADAGADIILKNKDTGKISTIVQCKAFNAKNVIKVKLVRELLGSMKDLGAQQGIFITTSSYTEDASELAKKNKIRAITTKDLLYLFSLFPLAKQQEIYDSIANSDYTTPVCASCGIKLVERIRSKGALKGKKFWGCPNFPKCRTSMNMQNSLFEESQDEENGIVLEVDTTIENKPTKTTYKFESQSKPILEDSLSNIHALQKIPERNTPNRMTSLEIRRNAEQEPKYHRHEMELEVFTAIDEKPTETAYKFKPQNEETSESSIYNAPPLRKSINRKFKNIPSLIGGLFIIILISYGFYSSIFRDKPSQQYTVIETPSTVRKEITKPETQPIENVDKYQYVIELYSGGTIYTDNAELQKDTVTYKGNRGLVVAINRSEIKTMKKVRVY